MNILVDAINPKYVVHSYDCFMRDIGYGEKMYGVYQGGAQMDTDAPSCTQTQANAGFLAGALGLGLGWFVFANFMARHRHWFMAHRNDRGGADYGAVFLITLLASVMMALFGSFVLAFLLAQIGIVVLISIGAAALFGLGYGIRYGAFSKPFTAIQAHFKRKHDRTLATARAVEQLRKDPHYEAAVAELDRMLGGNSG